MGNFEKLSVVVIVVIIVMILVVALHTWTDRPDSAPETGSSGIIEIGGDPLNNIDDPNRLIGGGGGLPEGPGGGFLPLPIIKSDWSPIDFPGVKPVSVEPTPPATPAFSTHLVVAGDSLGKLALDYYGSTRYATAISTANPGLGEYLRVGQELKIPAKEDVIQGGRAPEQETLNAEGSRPGGTYTTRKGDTWERISLRVYKTKDRWPEVFARNSALHESVYTELPIGLTIELPQ